MRYGGKEFWQASKKADFEKLSQNPSFKQHLSGTIEVWTWEEKTDILLKTFHGKSGKHTDFIRYRSIESRKEVLQKFLKRGLEIAEYKAKRKEENKGKQSEHALVASIIKKTLKQRYPNIKFSVKSDCFSGGDSVDIYWTDGPAYSQVDNFTSRYQGGYFDGMEDMYHYTTTLSVNEKGKIEELPSSKFVHCNRKISTEIREKITLKVAEMFDINLNDTQDAYKKLGRHIDQFVYQIYWNIDFTKISIDELLTRPDFLNFSNISETENSNK